MSWRIYGVTSELRTASDLALKRLYKDAGLANAPAAVYGPLGEAGELLAQLLSLQRRKRFDPTTAADIAARTHLSEKLIEHFDPTTAAGITARTNLSEKLIEHFDPTTAAGIAARTNLSEKLIEHFDPTTAAGIAARTNLSEHFNPNTSSGIAARQYISDKRIEHFDPKTASGIAARANLADKLAERATSFSLVGHAAKAQRIRELTNMLVSRIRTHHNQPDFDVVRWIDDLRGSQRKSKHVHTLAKADAGIMPEKLYALYRKKINDSMPEDTDEVMLGRDKALKEAFQERKLKATLTHIIDIPYDGGVFGPTTRDPSGHELQRIYTHLWWMTEGPVAVQKSKAKKPKQT